MQTSKPITLEQIQHQMQAALFKPSENTQLLEENIMHSSKLSAQARLNIYQHSYIMRLQQCMAAQFGALKYALGDKLFQMFIAQYLQAYPSSSYTLNDLGRNFSTFLEETRPDADFQARESWPGFMIELAEFEFILNRLFDENETNVYIPADETTQDDVLRLQPVLQLFQHQFPIAKYYQGYKNNDKPELPFPNETYSMVVRHNYRLGLFDLNAGQYKFLSLMQYFQSVDKVKQEMMSSFGHTQAELNQVWSHWRKKWINLGVFVAS